MPAAMQNTTSRLSALVAEIEAEAYARGRDDARGELLELLGTGGGSSAGARGARGKRAAKAAAPKRPARQRAARGSVPRFVGCVLRDRPGSTVAEIAAQAATEEERAVRVASIRTELHNGRARGRYVSEDGRWSLAGAAATPAAPENAESTDPPSGSPPEERAAAGGSTPEGTGPNEATGRETLRLDLG